VKTWRAVKRGARRPKAPRGQAMLEYTIVGHFLLIGGGLALLPAINLMFESITKFYDSVYAVIQTAAI
jgi:uncharacterized membrane protein